MTCLDTPKELPEYLLTLQHLSTPEEKISRGIQFMRDAISQEGAPRFREFWEIRSNLIPFFKQNIHPILRPKLWKEYVELTIEARKLKELFEEQSAFHAEQIDLAIQTVEEDIKNFPSLLQSAPVAIPSGTTILAQKQADYDLLQRELNLLHPFAARLNGLRQEIAKTELRIRYKTKFFKRIFELSNFVFPRRKQLIEQVSTQFERDVEEFIQKHFSNPLSGSSGYALREEIKALQEWAKRLTLSMHSFTKTRLALSECWDKTREQEKAQKKPIQQKRDSESDQTIKDKGKDSAQIELEQKKLQLRRQRCNDLKERIAQLQKENEKTPEELNKELEEIRKEITEVVQGKFEEQYFERLLRPLKDLIIERKENALLSLSEDKRNTLQQLHEVLKERKQGRAEIKEQLESYRKILASSNLDFEKSMLIQEQMELEKERLQKATASIAEIEQKIAEIKDDNTN